MFTDPNASARTSNIKVERPKIGDSYPSSIPNMRISNNKLTTVHGVEFSMHIYPPTGSLDERGKPTHMFTTVQSNVGAQTKMLGDVESWRTFFPELEKLIEGEKNMKCDVVLMEVNLALMDSQPPPHSFVGILHDVVIGCSTILNDSQWQARTTFYENRGHRVGQLLKTLKVQILEQSRIKLHDIPLESQFFVTRFSETLEGRRQIKKEEQKSQQDQGHSNW